MIRIELTILFISSYGFYMPRCTAIFNDFDRAADTILYKIMSVMSKDTCRSGSCPTIL